MEAEDIAATASYSHCQFFVERRKRYCRMLPSNGMQFCWEHATHEKAQDATRKRIPCPLDPKHTVFEDVLTKHLKKCNSRDKQKPVYHVAGINAGCQTIGQVTDSQPQSNTLSDVSMEEVLKVIEKVNRIYEEQNLSSIFVDTSSLCHPLLEEEIATALDINDKKRNNLVQNGSLLSQLTTRKFLRKDLIFVELGAGRGGLAYWIDKALTQSHEETDIVLVDRASIRHKFDSRYRDSGCKFTRLRINIEDLSLSKVPVIKEANKSLVVVSKHLCGDATDLSLRCLKTSLSETTANDSETDPPPTKKCRSDQCDVKLPIAGVMIALCCHHRCSWRQFTGRDKLARCGVTAGDFSVITAMSSWATCRRKTDRETRPASEDLSLIDERVKKTAAVVTPDNQDHDPGSYWHSRYGSLRGEDREAIGFQCKRLLDWARLSYVKEELGLSAELCRYVSRDVSLENMAIVATCPSS